MNKRVSDRSQYKHTSGGGRNYGNQNDEQPRQMGSARMSMPYQPNATSTTTTPSTVRSGSCVLCKSVTVLMCQRCGDFYCSPTCQSKDWPQHRYICFAMPQLVHSSTNIAHDMPTLNGFQNKELPPSTPNGPSQHRKYVRNNSATVPVSPPVQKSQQQQQQNRFTPPKAVDKLDTNMPRVNIKVDQVEFPRNNSHVLLTAFRSSNRIFLRSIEKEENEGYCAVIKAINDVGRTAGPLKIMPVRNGFAITDFNKDGLFYRVQVLSVKNENEIRVTYYDFGNEDTKKLSDLKEISQECAQLKQYIVPATLKHVPFVKDCEKLKEYLKGFEDVEAKIVYNEKEKPMCEILIHGVEESLNKKINLFVQKVTGSLSEPVQQQRQQSNNQQQQKQVQPTQQQQQKQESSLSQLQKPAPAPALQIPTTESTKKRPSQLVKPVMVPPFETVTLPEDGKNFNVIVVDNSLILFGYFGCMLLEDKANLQSIQTYLSEFDSTGRPYKPKIEEYCVAKYQDCWYRAKVLSIVSAEFVEVVFIDFLNESEVAINNIRRYPMDLDYPCKTSLCMIEELPSELSDDVVEYLKDKLQPGSEHIINRVKGMEEDSKCVIVQMNKIAEWLAKDNSV